MSGGVGEAAAAVAVLGAKRCLRSKRTGKFLRRLCSCCCKNGADGDDDELDGSYNYESRSTSVILSCCGTVTTDSVDNLQLNRNNSAYRSRDRHAASLGVATVTKGGAEDD